MPRPGFHFSVSSAPPRLLLLLPLALALLGIAARTEARVITYLFGFVGAAMLLILAITAFSREVFELDTTRKHYHQTRSALGLSGAEWRPLPAVGAVVVKYFSQYELRVRHRLRSEKPVRHYIVLLSVPGSAVGIVVHRYGYRQLAEARQLAARLADYLQRPLHVFDEPE